MSVDAKKNAASLLAWYGAMGVDEAISEAPIDRFAATVPRGAAKPALPSKAKKPAARNLERQKSPPMAARKSRLAAAAPPPALEGIKTLAGLEEAVRAFDGCALKRTAKNTCFSRGSDTARVMAIGEAPGRDEDLQGKPFVGRAGKLLDKMLTTIGLDETSVYITNTIYWRPPGNRTPTTEEMSACAPFLARQIELLSPDVMLLLGGAAAKSVLATTEGIMRLRGKWKLYKAKDRDIPVLATLHPAYLLRSPEAKRLAWHDLLMLKERLEAKTEA